MKTSLNICLIGATVAAFAASCGEQGLRSGDEVTRLEVDSTKSMLIGLSGKLFGIPSPIQTAILIKEAGLPYNSNALVEIVPEEGLASNVGQAIHLGMYGTSLAYTSLYEDGQATLQYFKAIDRVAHSLGIIGAIDPKIVNRLADNVSNADSLLLLSGLFYSAADVYLKENDRFDLAAYILLGAWTEASYLTALAAKGGTAVSRQRLAEQKEAVKTLYELMEQVADAEFKKGKVYTTLRDLNNIYGQAAKTYTFIAPQTLPDQKTTLIKSQTTYEINDEQLSAIATLLSTLRQQMTT